jgi:hypothetical protein
MSDDTTTDTATVDDTTTDTTDTTTEPIEGEEALGDPGKKALDSMKERLRAAEKAARDAKAEAAQIRREAEMRDKPAEEQALEAARAEARAEALAKANERILRSELRAAASGKLADPTDAALFIDLSQFDVSGDGDVDSDALNDAIADLISRKPHLAVQKQARFEGSGDQGPKREAGKLAQIGETEVKAAYAAKNYTQIAAWRQAGQLDDYMKSS